MMGAAQTLYGRLQIARLPSMFMLLGLITSYASALQHVPGSNCTALCAKGDASPATRGSDIVCNDPDFNNTATGSAFQTCVSCELRSQALDQETGQTDVGWAMYNLRYALDWCIFGFPTSNDQVLSNPCIETCSLVATTLETNILTPNTSLPYDYCQGGSAFLTNLTSCAFCQSLVPNRVYLSNFLKTLNVACQSQPSPSTAFPISPLQIFTIQPPASYATIANTSRTHGLSRGAKIAIGVIVPLVILLLLALFSLYWYRRYQSSTSTAHKYRPQQSSLDERWGDAHISRPTGGASRYASTNPPVSGSQSYFQSPEAGAQSQYSSLPLETQYPPVPVPRPEQQPQVSHSEAWRYSQPSPFDPPQASNKGKTRDMDVAATTLPAQAESTTKKGFGKSIKGLNPIPSKKPKVSINTAARTARGRDDLEESPSDLFG